MYVKMAEEEDNKMAERWKADAEGILIFVSGSILFLCQWVRQLESFRQVCSLLR